MSLARNTPDPNSRDIQADYVQAYLSEFASYKAAGNNERAEEVAVLLRHYGVDIPKKPAAGTKERAVTDPAVETAVEGDAPPKRRGRPRKETE